MIVSALNQETPMKDIVKLGRPTGPSENRSGRPWDPQELGYKERVAVNYVAANPGMYRWVIARHLKISLSRLSILTCCAQGQEHLESIKERPLGYLIPFRISWTAIDVSSGKADEK